MRWPESKQYLMASKLMNKSISIGVDDDDDISEAQESNREREINKLAFPLHLSLILE